MNEIRVKYNKLLKPFVHEHRRFKIIIGGRGSSKTMSVAAIMTIFCMLGHKICCFRQFWSSIDDSQYTEIKDVIMNHDLPGFTIQNNKIFHSSGGFITFKGLERNLSNVKGLKGFKYFWLEEGQDISEQAIRTLTPTLREEESELWMTANPQRVEDPLSQRFIEIPLEKNGRIEQDELHMRIRINYDDNPWFPESLETERQWDFKHLDRAIYNWTWLGAYNDSVDNSIIKMEWFDAVVNAQQKIGWQDFGAVVTAHDPADSQDARATCVKHGNTIKQLYNDTTNPINEALAKSIEIAHQNYSRHFVYDSDGCGLGLRDQVERGFNGTATNIHAFRGGAMCEDPETVISNDHAGRPTTNRQFYKNLRAQKYHQIAQAFERTYNAVENKVYTDPMQMISIDESCDFIPELRSELTSIARVYNTAGIYQLMSKDEAKRKLKVRSPNLSDAMMMSSIQLIEPRKIKKVSPGFRFA